MSDFTKIEVDAVARCKRILDSMNADEGADLAASLLDDREQLEAFIKVIFGFYAMARFQNRTEEATKLSHIAAYVSIQGFLFEEWKKQEAAEGN